MLLTCPKFPETVHPHLNKGIPIAEYGDGF